MARRRNISAVISLKDNMSATMRGIRREQRQFQREVRQTRAAIRSADRERMRIRMDATPAHRAIQNLRRRMAPLRQKLVTAVAMKDETIAKLNRIKSNLKSVGKFVATPAIKARDAVSGVLGKIKGTLGKLTSLKTAIPVTLALAMIGAPVKAGMDLERQQISMRHFMGVGNKGKSNKQLDKMSASYLKDLRNNANATPFETGEVVQAGTRALQIAGGSSKEGMKLVKLAEDMAALNPGKSISDAMEALADMNMGEYARLTEFGVKATKEKGDTPESVQKQLQELYTGGAGKLSSSGSGLLSTFMGKLKSNFADIGLGMLEPLKPAMEGAIGFIDQMSPKMIEFGSAITNGIGSAIGWLQQQMPVLGPVFQSVFQSMGTIVSTTAPVIGQVLSALSPVFIGLFQVAGVAFKGIATIVQTVAPVVKTLITSLKPAFSSVGSVLKSLGSIFSSVFNGIMKVVKKASDFIKPLIKGIGGAVSGVARGVSGAIGWVANKTGRNATGTKYWGGGLSVVGEHGPELVQMPSGSKVYTNRETNTLLNKPASVNRGNSNAGIVNKKYIIEKIADKIIVRKESDIDTMINKLLEKLDNADIAFSRGEV